MAKEVCLTEEEVLKNPNNSLLGEIVRKKYWESKNNQDMDKNLEKLLLNKLRQPIHKNYICKYIFRYSTQEDCDKELDRLVNEGLIEESPLATGYYVAKSPK